MREKDTLITYLVFGILICAVLGALGLFLPAVSPSGDTGRMGIVYDPELISFNRDWRISAGGYGEFEPDELPFSPVLPAGTAITAVNTLPASVTSGTYLAFMSLYSVTDVYVGNELIYTTPVTVNGGRVTPVPGWVFIPLTEEYSGRLISLVTVSPYASFSGTVCSMLLGTHSEVLLYGRDSRYFDLYIAVTVMVLGLIVILFSLLIMSRQQPGRAHLFTGLFMTVAGAALLSGVGLPRLSASGHLMEYIAGRLIMMICPLVYSASVYTGARGKLRGVFPLLAAASFLGFILCFAAHFAGWADLTATSVVPRVLMAACLAAAFYCGVVRSSGEDLYYRILIGTGIVCLGAGTLLEGMPRLLVYGTFIHLRYLMYLIFALTHTVSVVFIAYREATRSVVVSRELTESRLKLMMSQIQPHFIQNTLSTIRAMIPTDPQKAYDMIYDFADYLRYNINSLGNIPIIPFEEELKHIKAYTDIESLRFGERVGIVYDIFDTAFSVPPLSVQPLVENAVKHGVCKKLEGGTVRISSFLSEDAHTVTVEDDGAGFDTSILAEADSRGVGIKNAVYRLENQTGAKVDIISVPGKGTKVTIRIPAERRSADENDTRG